MDLGADLTSKPLSPYDLKDRQITELRVSLAKAADLLRMDGKLLTAEKLYRRASQYADGGAAKHLIRTADHCRQIYERQKKAKQRKAVR